MIITLYRNISAPNVVRKRLVLVDTIEGVLHEPSSIIAPTIIIERNTPTGFNYINIPAFNRYYYVTGISSMGNSLVAVTMKVDVLMSFSNEIGELNAIVRRQENNYNLYLDDGIFKAYQNPLYKQIAFPNSFHEYSYILALAGNSGS